MSEWINWTAPPSRAHPPHDVDPSEPVRVRMAGGQTLYLHRADVLMWCDLGDLLTIVAYRKVGWFWRLFR